MKRSLWAALGVVLVALAVPTMALATHGHRDAGHGHHRRAWTGPTGAGATVTTYDQGVLTLSLSDGGTLTGKVSDHTHFVCLGSPSYAHRKATARIASFRHSGNDGSSGDTGSSGSTGTTGTTGTTGSSGSGGYGGQGRGYGSGGTGGYGSYDGGGYGRGHGRGFGHSHHGYGQGHNSYTPPPPCDSSRLVNGAALQSAAVLVVPGGAQFSTIVLLPAVQ